MPDSSTLSDQSEQRQSALLRILKATTTLPAKITFYASALGAVALVSGADLPPVLAALTTGVGVNVLSSILERVAQGEAVTDDEIRHQVRAAIDQSCIADLLTADEFQCAVGELLQQQRHLERLMQQGEYDLIGRLLDQYLAYRSLIVPIQEDLTALRVSVQALATQQQGEEIIALLQRIICLIETGRVDEELDIFNIQAEPWKSAARHILGLAKSVELPPLGVTCAAIIEKLKSIMGDRTDVLSEAEAFVLLAAICLPHLWRWHENYQRQMRVEQTNQFAGDLAQQPSLPNSMETVSAEQVRQFASDLAWESSAPESVETTLREMAAEISAVANARTGFNLEDAQYSDSWVRGERVRLRLLGALLHLAARLNLDQYLDPAIPSNLEGASWPERSCWWRQAYVRSSAVELQRLQLHFQLPKGHKEEYRSILVGPLDQEIRSLLDIYDPVLILAGINLKHIPADVVEKDVPVVPDEDWRLLKREIETQQARRIQDRLHQDAARTQYLQELLVKGEVGRAEQMVVEGRHLEAARAFANATALLKRAREAAQARHYAVQAAEQYLASGDKLAAGQQYLTAAEVWLDSAHVPEVVAKQLEEAHKLAVELGVPVFQVCVLLAQAWAAFATLRDHDAKSLLEQASELILQIDDETQRTELSRTLALRRVTLAMVWEEWSVASEVLDAALAACPETAQIEHLDLLQCLLLLGTERGDWETADSAYQEARQLADEVAAPEQRGLLTMHYGASLARRGALEAAYKTYSAAIQQLEGHTDAYTLGLAYRNMQYMLRRNGVFSFPNFAQHEARRIDLFQSTEIENRGYAYELQAAADLSTQKYRGAMQHIRLTLAHYWQEGAWTGIEHAYRILGKLNAATDRPVEALLAAIRASDGKAAEQYSQVLRDTSDRQRLDEVVSVLLRVRPAACEQWVVVKALGVLADVISPKLLPEAVNLLVSLLEGPEDNEQHMAVRRHAIEALRYVVPQLTTAQTSWVLQVALDQLRRQQFWVVTEELWKLINEFFILTQCQVDPLLYTPVAEAVFNFSGNDHLHREADRVAVHLARTAPPEVRAQVIERLQSCSDQLDRLTQLAVLEESIPEEQLGAVIEQILRAINPRPIVKGKETIFSFSGVRPLWINSFNKVLPPSLYNRVIDGLLEALLNEHNHLGNRSETIWALSDLPIEVLIERADEVADYLLWGAAGTLPRSSHVDWTLESQTDPFSSFCMNMGNIEQVRRSSLRALGRLYAHVDPNHRERIEASLIAASRDKSPMVRQGVAMALETIEGDVALPMRLLLALVVLLHDPDPEPCSWACAASGNLIVRRLTNPFVEDLVERLLNLAETASVVDVRLGTAVGLQTLAENNYPDDPIIQQRVMATLTALSQDVSFRVRRQITAQAERVQ